MDRLMEEIALLFKISLESMVEAPSSVEQRELYQRKCSDAQVRREMRRLWGLLGKNELDLFGIWALLI